MIHAKVISVVIVAALGFFGASAPGQSQEPAALACGDTITTDVTLSQDLLNCPGAGLVIGADDVTLDLNGHVIDGDGVGDAPGVLAVEQEGVVIRNGSIRDFVEGVAAARVDGLHVRHVQVSNSRHVGIYVERSERVRLRDSTVIDTVFAGIATFFSTNVRIVDNFSSHNGAGINITAGRDVLVASNLVTRSGFVGLVIETNRAVVRGNVVRANGIGVIVHANHARITRNQVLDTIGCVTVPGGCVQPPPGPCPECAEGFGISVEGGTGNVIADNEVRRTLRHGISVRAYDPALPIRGTIVRGNLTRGAALDGISVTLDGEGALGHTRLVRNRALASGDDGVDVRSKRATLKANLAHHNGDFGITAVAGVTDGGGNRARDNGNGAQCRNVDCRP